MQFSRQEKAIMVRDDISKVVKSSIVLVDHQLTINNVKIFQEIEENLDPIIMNANQIEQVMLNLLLNAQHAMENNATKKITVRVKDGKNGYARVEVQDTGIGMSETVKKRIFEPFFTTKASGKGTGLGLSVSFGIIKSHKAIISVESEEGVGTNFIIDFPYEKTMMGQVSENTDSGIWTDPKKPVVMNAYQMPMPTKHPEKENQDGGYRGEDPILIRSSTSSNAIDDTVPSAPKPDIKVLPPKPLKAKPQTMPDITVPSAPVPVIELEVPMPPPPPTLSKQELEYIPRKKSVSNLEIKRPTRRS